MELPLKNILYWNIFISILPFIAAINTSVIDLTLGVAIIWISFVFLFFGSAIITNKKTRKYEFLNENSVERDYKVIIFLSTLSLGLSVYAANFYTGNSFINIVTSLINGDLLYNNYQKYFKEHNIGVFSLSKLPAIFSMLFVKMIMFYCFYCLLLMKEKLKVKDLILLLLCIIPSIYFSIARGTSFEIFNILILSWFAFIVRYMKFDLKFKFLSKTFIIGGSFIILCMFAYDYNISARYSFEFTRECVTTTICYDNSTFLNSISPSIAYFTAQMAGYFTFGLLYTSSFISEFFLSRFNDFGYFFIPYGYVSEYKATSLCNLGFDCGANWIPDVIKIIYNNGFIFYILIVFVVGFLLSYILNKRSSRDIDFIGFVSSFYCFYFFISLHVGNFITSASDNQLMIFFVTIAIFFKYLRRKLS